MRQTILVVSALAFNYISYTLQIHDYLMELKRLLLPYGTVPQISAWIADVDHLNEKLEKMHFQVAVVGEFKRGKTSFINALLRKQILPADVVPATATINRITYGDVPASYIQWKDGRPDEKIEIEQLSDYITKLTDSSAMQARSIKEAIVRYPCRFCENNVDLIDTPGMNDDDTMNSVTIQQLSDIDLAIVTLDPNAPVSNTEACFIAQLVESDQICQIVFVVSKMDTIFAGHRERLLDLIRQRLQDCVREVLLKTHKNGDEVMEKFQALFSEIILFPISSTQALYAYEIGDQQMLEDSGFQRLNDELLPLIIRTQHSAAILTPLHTVVRISGEFQQLLQTWEARTDAEAALDKLKKSFAETAYGQHLNPEQLWQSCENDLKQQMEARCRSVYDSILASIRQSDSRTAIIPCIKELYQRLNVELAQEENGSYLQIQNQYLCPVYRGLKQQLTQLVQPHPDIFLKIVSYLDGMDRVDPPVAQFASPEPFYWEVSPIPPDSMRQGQVAYFVDNAVRASFEGYYQRREARLSDFLQKRLEAQEQEIVHLVQSFFQFAKLEESTDGIVRLDQSTYVQMDEWLSELVCRCNTAREDYIRQSKNER